MSLDNLVEREAIDHVHYHQCGASTWDLGIFPRENVELVDKAVLEEAKRLQKLGKLDMRTQSHKALGLKYKGPFKGIGCGHIWKHNELMALGDEKAHICPECGYFESYALEPEDLEALGVALDKIQFIPAQPRRQEGCPK